MAAGTATHYRLWPMKKTPEEKPKAAAALLKQRQPEVKVGQAKLAVGNANLAIPEREHRAVIKSKPKATQPPFYPQPPKRIRFGVTQTCSKISPAEAEARFKELGK